MIQKKLDIFRITLWNNHRVRKQKNKDLPTGVPKHIFSFPEKYGSENYGLHITEEQLVDVAMECDMSDDTDDYLSEDFLLRCEMQFVGTCRLNRKRQTLHIYI